MYNVAWSPPPTTNSADLPTLSSNDPLTAQPKRVVATTEAVHEAHRDVTNVYPKQLTAETRSSLGRCRRVCRGVCSGGVCRGGGSWQCMGYIVTYN